MQKSVSKDTEEDDNTGGINLDKAKERLQEEDRFDKEEYRKKIKAKHRVSSVRRELTERARVRAVRASRSLAVINTTLLCRWL